MLSSKWQMYNILILGGGFLLLFTAFQTTANVETTTIGIFFSPRCNSTEVIDYADDVGFYSLCIIYFFVAVFTWLSPPITGLLGQKLSLIICGGAYCLLIGALIRPLIPTIFITSAILGAAGGVLWTAQGQVLFANSNPDTVGRNSGIFWLMLESSLVLGNLYYYLFVRFISPNNNSSNSQICFSSTANIILYSTLTGLGVIGVLTFILIRKNKKDDPANEEVLSSEVGTNVQPLVGETQKSLSQTTKDIIKDEENLEHISYASKFQKLFITALKDFVRSFQILFTVKMGLLVVCFVYTGLELTFWSGVYGTLAVRTLEDTSVAGLVGMMIGVGEIVGGGLFGILGHWTRRMGRDPIVLGGLFVHMVTFLLVFYIVPGDAPYNFPTKVSPYFFAGRPDIQRSMILFTAFLLGFGDSCFNTQVYSILGEVYKGRDGGPAMALFKFYQSIAACIAFLYNGLANVDLQWQLLILVISGVLGTICFIVVEWTVQKEVAMKKMMEAKEENTSKINSE